MSSKPDLKVKDVPDVVLDPKSRKRYARGRYLGKGGFAKCYELVDPDTKEILAGKIVSKALLVKPHQKEKMTQEIAIHRSLKDHHVVGFRSFFEDDDNVYILLELCTKRSLMELHKRRKAITEPEARYFTHQTLLGVKYLHENKVIHRDLKLGNLFLNDTMEIKIGDFGLATKLDYDGERKKTLCGTPNYIAPEVLAKKGHSYEVDVWSLGCILYTLLVGKPPFETASLKETYMRIKKNEYHVPSRVSPLAKNLIDQLLQADPGARPSVSKILDHDFFSTGFLPTTLPTSCLSTAPRFALSISSMGQPISRKPLGDVNSQGSAEQAITAHKRDGENKVEGGESGKVQSDRQDDGNEMPADFWLSDLHMQLTQLMASKPAEKPVIREDEAEEPAACPIYWISKWVDYSDKYGLGYQLSDGSVGVLFNDSTRLVLNEDGETMQYIEKEGAEHFHKMSVYPDMLTKKVTLLKYFRNYMSEHLLKAGANMKPRDADNISRLPFLRTWFRTRSAIVLHLSNGTLQINFFQDHTKVILCPIMGASTYIDDKRNFRTFRFNLLEEHGCSRELASRMRYARTMVERLMASKSGSARLKSA
ncbi:PREDICTED: serine/threonine-protein kinase PLK1-like isoform X2 [Priapulus caudatus]|uniref:Serine/threonine-protein kinase PLK n=1 Tax=Priapulus caudatus TaxID=37621 RepID=A0ABM1DPS8_PRICU|nr:PREDICTED: serine/threonine-protein kinase PLK1-like isoform X2 [Priapulus caudatus]